jgi:hypothetical protein
MSERKTIATSLEADIIRQIEEFIRKVATDQATAKDLQRLQDLQQTRVNLMRPKLVSADGVDFDRIMRLRQF